MIPFRNSMMNEDPLKKQTPASARLLAALIGRENGKPPPSGSLAALYAPSLFGLTSPKTERVSVTTPAQLGSLIKSVRKSQGLTQQQFADLSGVGRRFIVECEAGKPRLEFAKVLQVAASAGIDIFAVKR
jgi:y4mF family transcriptional regulator